MTRRLGLFGFGAFGRLIVQHLSPLFEILVHDPAPAAMREARRWNVRPARLEEAAAAPIVVLAPPVDRLEALALEIAPFVRPRALVIDVASVKVKPAAWLDAAIPAGVDVIGAHPLFGPQSASEGVRGLEVVICPVRSRRVRRVVGFLTSLGLKVTLDSPENHDRALAAVQGLTHLIAKVLGRLEPLPRAHTTVSYDLVMKGASLVQGDSEELFLAIERDNPYASDVRRRFLQEVEMLCAGLERGPVEPGGGPPPEA
jgi:prephenate dehydrogenase